MLADRLTTYRSFEQEALAKRGPCMLHALATSAPAEASR
jgi:hypothetical protein